MKRFLVLGFAGMFLGSSVGFAAEVYVYPRDGQSAEKQKADEYECYGWAKGQTRFDPMAPPTASSAPPQEQATQGGALRGAARGAALGAAVGAIAGDAGTGAAAGAAGGGLIGGMRRRDQTRQQATAQNNWAQEEAARYDQMRRDYDRAYGVCLEARGYSVK